jgi:hypothetical protein
MELRFNLEDEGSTFVRNIDKLVPDYTASHPRRYHSSKHRSDNLKFLAMDNNSVKWRIHVPKRGFWGADQHYA